MGFVMLLKIAIVCSMVTYSACINCFYCNSANNSACTDLEAAGARLVVPVVHCETAVPGPVHVRFFCRKIVQTIFHSHRDAELRVTRGCGWVADARACYRADNTDHLETVCQCHQDRCNGGASASCNVVLLVLGLIGSVVMLVV